jgi:cytochrome c biogenesis protein CcmG, thiol:disulfide interchange protein DsbE
LQAAAPFRSAAGGGVNKLPFILFLILVAFFATLLLKGQDPAIIPSPLIGKPAPVFNLPAAANGLKGFSSKDLKGRPSIVNFFASWCAGCEVEHETLAKMAATEQIPLYGVDYKDTPEKLTEWLKKHSNPYAAIGADKEGKISIDWGVYGAPETFIIDANGIIRYKHVGPVTEQVYEDNLKPLLRKLK